MLQVQGLRAASPAAAAGQSQVTYTWDNASRLTAISQGSQSVGLNYDNANRRTCVTLSNGVIATYGYDNDSRVTSLVYGTGGSCSSPPNNLGNLTYTYDADGRRTATAGSLAAVTLPANVTGTTSYNADNEQSTFNGTSLSYDANGNLTGDGTNTYTWDARNQLTQITQRRTTVATFAYDAFGRRMNKTVSGTTTQFLYDGLNPVQELNSSNGVAANLLTGLGIDEYFTRTDTATSTFLADALGSTIGLVISNNGPLATNYTYQPFGAATVSGVANGNLYQFTGRENDGTSLYFYRARYYSPTFQRFIAQDPIGFAGGDLNSYAYVGNDALNTVDPLGLTQFSVSGGSPFNLPDSNAVYKLVQDAFRSATPTGSACQTDPNHSAAASLLVRNEAIQKGSYFIISSDDYFGSLLLQSEGTFNGHSGIYEYIIPINVDLFLGSPIITHQVFIPGAPISGVPNNWGGRKAPPFVPPGEL